MTIAMFGERTVGILALGGLLSLDYIFAKNSGNFLCMLNSGGNAGIVERGFLSEFIADLDLSGSENGSIA
jgi:hypothetical protein